MEPLRDDRQEGYQPGGQAWDPLREDVIALLGASRHVDSYPIYYGSNYTFLVTVEGPSGERSLAVYKPRRGEYPLHDFPAGTLYRREIAAWHLDRLLGWGIVPPTTATHGDHGIGSLQIYIEGKDSAQVDIGELRRFALFDALANNADRKIDHCLPALDGHLWGIDHGLTFNAQPKLRTFLWHFAGAKLKRREIDDVTRTAEALERVSGDDACALKDLVSRVEWMALRQRLSRIVNDGRLPDPRYKPVPYRW